jgi:hypothetical protein
MKKPVQSEKENYVKQRLLQLEDWRTHVDMLKVKADRRIASTRSQYNQQIDELLSKYLQAQTKLNGLQNASERAWGDCKLRVDRAWQELINEYDKARSKFK